MPAAAPVRRPNKVTFGPVALDRDMVEWVMERAKALEVPRSYVVRQAIRAAMRAEAQRENQAS